MASLSASVIDSVKSLSLNGSSEKPNEVLNGDVSVRTICCVGAGYVGMCNCSDFCSGFWYCQGGRVERRMASMAVWAVVAR